MSNLNVQRKLRLSLKRKQQAEALFLHTKTLADYEAFCKLCDEHEILEAIEKEIASNYTNFFPNAAQHKWKEIEIEPITMIGKELSNGIFKFEFNRTDNPKEIFFYSVYLKDYEGAAHCIADLPTFDLARNFANLLRNSVRMHNGNRLDNLQNEF